MYDIVRVCVNVCLSVFVSGMLKCSCMKMSARSQDLLISWDGLGQGPFGIHFECLFNTDVSLSTAEIKHCRSLALSS